MKKLIQPHFLRFLIVGGLGTITNLVLFFLLVDILQFRPIPITVGTFIIAVLQNYLLNHDWTFSDITKKKPANINGLIKFLFLAFIFIKLFYLLLSLLVLATVYFLKKKPIFKNKEIKKFWYAIAVLDLASLISIFVASDHYLALYKYAYLLLGI